MKLLNRDTYRNFNNGTDKRIYAVYQCKQISKLQKVRDALKDVGCDNVFVKENNAGHILKKMYYLIVFFNKGKTSISDTAKDLLIEYMRDIPEDEVTDTIEVQSFDNMLPPRLDKAHGLPSLDSNPETAPSIKVDSSCGCDGFSCKVTTTSSRMFHQSKSPTKDVMVDIKLSPDDWVFSQLTALGSCEVESDGYTITAESADLGNDNGVAISNEMLAKYYKNFIGGHNYKNHVHDIRKSHGFIVDSVLRPIEHNGKRVYYVDLLIATNKHKDKDWAEAIRTRTIKYSSMGCNSASLQCSHCGNIASDEKEFCEHQMFNLGSNYIDNNGVIRKTYSLMHDMDSSGRQGMLDFFEMSHLDVQPAFDYSIVSHVIDIPRGTKEVSFKMTKEQYNKEAVKLWSPYFKKGK